MLKPVMNKYFITIYLVLLCLLVSSLVEARLTLGVLVGTDAASGQITSDQAHSLVSLLAEKLQEEIIVKELSDSATLINWLDHLAALDLALLSAKDVKSYRGRFLLVGQLDELGKLNLVAARQGIIGDLPQRAARIIRESGFAPWRFAEEIAPPATQLPEESVPFSESESVSIDEVIAAQTELQHVPSLSPGRAWGPQKKSVYRDVLPSDEPLTKKLVLGVVPDGVSGQTAPIVDQLSTIGQESVLERQKPAVELAVETVGTPVQKLMPPAPVYTEPIEPLVPPEIIVKTLPELPETAEPISILPVPEVADVASSLPATATAPVEPFQPAMIEAVKSFEIIPKRVSEEPVIAVTPATPQAVVVPEPVVPAEPPVVSAVPVLEPKEIVFPPVPEEPVVAVVPQVVIAPEPVTLPKGEQSEKTAFIEDAVPREPELPMATSTGPGFNSESVAGNEEQKIIEEVLEFAEAMPAHESPERSLLVSDDSGDELSDDEIIALLGEDTVAAVVAQPDIPPELRPPGIPIVRPGRITRRTTAAEDELLVASIPEPRKQAEPARPPNLLPEQEPDPGIIYVVPFTAVMVPGEVHARIFDQFVDTMNQKGEALGLQFVILKKGLQQVAPEWLAVRKYVTGEIYAYVEDSGSSWTELRSKARLVYRRPNQDVPAFKIEFPVKGFFDHDRSTIDIERIKLSDAISATLSNELLKALESGF